ncbi:MAG: glutathione S-transferase family protein [Rickettsiales bacterium]|nr:glutathione S-transferase family protein [Rickettsiales bacterium]
MFALFHSPLMPACRKVRVLLREKEIDFQLVEEDFWQRRVDFFRLNPAGEVPVLMDEKALTLCGAYSICEYLEEAFKEVRLMGYRPEESAEIRRLVEWFDVKFEKEVTNNILFEKVYRRLMGYGEPSSEAIRAGKKNLSFHMDYLNYLLNDRNWLAGEYITLADITAASQLSALDYLGDVDWEGRPCVKDWYALIKSRPSFREILEDRITGFRPPSHYMDPDF